MRTGLAKNLYIKFLEIVRETVAVYDQICKRGSPYCIDTVWLCEIKWLLLDVCNVVGQIHQRSSCVLDLDFLWSLHWQKLLTS